MQRPFLGGKKNSLSFPANQKFDKMGKKRKNKEREGIEEKKLTIIISETGLIKNRKREAELNTKALQQLEISLPESR